MLLIVYLFKFETILKMLEVDLDQWMFMTLYVKIIQNLFKQNFLNNVGCNCFHNMISQH